MLEEGKEPLMGRKGARHKPRRNSVEEVKVYTGRWRCRRMWS